MNFVKYQTKKQLIENEIQSMAKRWKTATLEGKKKITNRAWALMAEDKKNEEDYRKSKEEMMLKLKLEMRL